MWASLMGKRAQVLMGHVYRIVRSHPRSVPPHAAWCMYIPMCTFDVPLALPPHACVSPHQACRVTMAVPVLSVECVVTGWPPVPVAILIK